MLGLKLRVSTRDCSSGRIDLCLTTDLPGAPRLLAHFNFRSSALAQDLPAAAFSLAPETECKTRMTYEEPVELEIPQYAELRW